MATVTAYGISEQPATATELSPHRTSEASQMGSNLKQVVYDVSTLSSDLANEQKKRTRVRGGGGGGAGG